MGREEVGGPRVQWHIVAGEHFREDPARPRSSAWPPHLARFAPRSWSGTAARRRALHVHAASLASMPLIGSACSRAASRGRGQLSDAQDPLEFEQRSTHSGFPLHCAAHLASSSCPSHHLSAPPRQCLQLTAASCLAARQRLARAARHENEHTFGCLSGLVVHHHTCALTLARCALALHLLAAAVVLDREASTWANAVFSDSSSFVLSELFTARRRML